MRSVRALLRLLGLLVVEAGTVVGLHGLGRVPALALPGPGDWPRWLATGAPADVVMAVLRVVALGCAWWLLASTVLYVVVLVARLPRAVAAVRWTTLPAVRRVAERGVAVTLAASMTVGPGGVALASAVDTEGASAAALRAEVVPGVALPPALDGGAWASVPGVVLPPALDGGAWVGASDPPVPVVAGPEAATVSAVESADGASPATHAVMSGEHLWRVAADTVAAARGVSRAEVPARAVHRYWTALITANDGVLRSGDPDLVFPGEELVLPPVDP